MLQRTIEDVATEFNDFRFTLNIAPHIRDRFMPQSMYCSHSRADHGRYITNASLQPTIVFYPKRFEPTGIALRDVLSSNIRTKDLLANPDELVLHHGPPSASIRLQVYHISSVILCTWCLRLLNRFLVILLRRSKNVR
jgi:hypothetical protein